VDSTGVNRHGCRKAVAPYHGTALR
jgi:hypothetical protein